MGGGQEAHRQGFEIQYLLTCVSLKWHQFSLITIRPSKGNRDLRTRSKNIARIANAVPVTLYSRVTMNVEIVVLDCQKCNQCLKGHKSLGLVVEGVLKL